VLTPSSIPVQPNPLQQVMKEIKRDRRALQPVAPTSWALNPKKRNEYTCPSYMRGSCVYPLNMSESLHRSHLSDGIEEIIQATISWVTRLEQSLMGDEGRQK
jgi:hypothetical protein